MARIHTHHSPIHAVIKDNFVGLVVTNRAALIKERNKIIPYSAIKINANKKDENSVLNPDTSSDSPSAKSKGVRLVSATQEIIHKITTGIKTKILRKLLLFVEQIIKFVLNLIASTLKSRRANLIS